MRLRLTVLSSRELDELEEVGVTGLSSRSPSLSTLLRGSHTEYARFPSTGPAFNILLALKPGLGIKPMKSVCLISFSKVL